MEARRRGASDTSAQSLGTGGPRRARAEKARPAPAWVPRTEGFGPALAEGAELRGVPGRGTARPSRARPGVGRGPQPSPASLTSGAASEQHGGGEGQQEQQQQAGEESHGAAGQPPVRVR